MDSQSGRQHLTDPSAARDRDLQERHVVLMINTVGAYGRHIIRGIAQYARSLARWRFLVQTPTKTSVPTMAGWQPTGIIGQVTDEIAPALARLKLPFVNISTVCASIPFPQVCPDNMETGRMAARELLARGFRLFGYYGPLLENSLQRARGFEEEVQQAGFSCDKRLVRSLDGRPKEWNWEQIQRELGQWLVSLEKPVGVMAFNDDRGFRLLEACARMGLRVPEDVAVIGVDDDATYCSLASPNLSSVALPLERIGFEAARLLEQLMQGEAPPAQPILLPPTSVVIRASCDTMAIADPEVSLALSYIRQHIHQPITVEEIVEQVSVSRRNLERRFRQVLGRSPRAEILRLRLERAKQLLRDTDLKIPTVADRSGFSTSKLFAGVFHRAVGLPPSNYRKRYRLG